MTDKVVIDVVVVSDAVNVVASDIAYGEVSIEANVVPNQIVVELGVGNLNVWLKTSNPILIQGHVAYLGDTPFGGVAYNMAMVYVDLQPSDFNGDGTLKNDRPYVVEHYSCTLNGSSIVFHENLDGKYAVVSYL